MKEVGNLSLDKGEIRPNKKLFAWDGVNICNPDICPVADKCRYPQQGKCSVQVQYLDQLYTALQKSYKYVEDVILFKIGMHVVPLYVQLMKLQMIELSLETPVVVNDKGTHSIHPVFREIRDTLKTIAVMWKDLQITFEFNGNPDLSGDSSDGSDSPSTHSKKDFEKGDPTYYKKIAQIGPSRKGIVR